MGSANHDVVVIGAGQAGLALSYHLCASAVDHVILEKGRIANAWREDRWDSFCLVTPNWTITLPGAPYRGDDPDGFMPCAAFVAYLEDWAASFAAPVREGVIVAGVRARTDGGTGFLVETDQGPLTARQVVVATATYQTPRVPTVLDALPRSVRHIPASRYRNPADLPEGGVLVIGSGQTGCQIAEELNTAGRDTYLSVGRSGRLPRRYRGRDCIEWQRDMGWLDRTPDMLADPALRFRGDPHLTGADGGRTLSLHQLRADGVTPVGRLETVKGGTVGFADDVSEAVLASDVYARGFREAVDTHIRETGVSAPGVTEADLIGDPAPGGGAFMAPLELNLESAGIATVISATGFVFDFSWVDFPVLDRFGYPETTGGATRIPGLYFMGLNWMTKRKSGIIYGVAEDAARLATMILSHSD